MAGKFGVMITKPDDILLLLGTTIAIGVLSGMCGHAIGYTDGVKKGFIEFGKAVDSMTNA